MIELAKVLAMLSDAKSATEIIQNIGYVYQQASIRRLNILLDQAYTHFHRKGETTPEFQARIETFSSSESGREILHGLVRKALHAESDWGARILGLILGSCLGETKIIEFKDRIIASALLALSDYEIDLVVKIHSSFEELPVPEAIKEKFKENRSMLEEELKANSFFIKDFHDAGLLAGDVNMQAIAVENIKRLGIFVVSSKYNGRAIATAIGCFQVTEISERLAHYAQATKQL